MEKYIKSLLNELGLEKEESQIYLGLLELGQSNMKDLAYKAGVKRTSAYNYVKNLIKKGLLVSSKNKKRAIYSAVHPNQLIEIQKGRLNELNKIFPELLAVYNKPKNKPRVTFYEGLKGIKEVYADTLKEKRPIVGWSDFEHMAEALGEYYFDVYPPERAKRKIPIQTFIPDTPASKKFVSKDIRYLRETKLLPSSNWTTEINIYGGKVALMSFRSSPPFVVLIEDPGIAQTLKAIWKQLWERVK